MTYYTSIAFIDSFSMTKFSILTVIRQYLVLI